MSFSSSSKGNTAQPQAALPTMQIVDTPEDSSQDNHAPQDNRTLEQLKSALESLLFVAGRPLERAELRRLLSAQDKQVQAALAALTKDCEQRGIRVQHLGEQVQLVSAPENAQYVAALLGLPTQAKLSTATLETLAIVAYRQPITRSQIEIIRGVNSDHALASLVAHSLVSEVGRAPTVGRPALFATTPEFLQQFGLESLETLPKLGLSPETLSNLEAATQGEEAEQERRSLPKSKANGAVSNGHASMSEPGPSVPEKGDAATAQVPQDAAAGEEGQG
jgi:segregation and condensation protein B